MFPGGTLKRRKAPPEGFAGRAGFRPYPGEFRAVRPDASRPGGFLPSGMKRSVLLGGGRARFRFRVGVEPCQGARVPWLLFCFGSYPQAEGTGAELLFRLVGSELSTRTLRRHLRQLLGGASVARVDNSPNRYWIL